MKYVLLPLIAGLIGWFTNYIAVWMLFNPKNPIKILGITFQGIFPKRQKILAERIGKLVAEQLLHSSDLKEKLLNAETVGNITEMVEDKIDDYLLNVFPEKYPITSIFFGAKRKAQIKMDLLDEVQHAVPELLNAYADQIDEKIDIEAIVTEKVENLNSDMLEKLLNNILKSEFKFIEWVGAILGFLIGIVQILVSELL